jgi:hypothetical protein
MNNEIKVVICPDCLELDSQLNCFLSGNVFQCNHCNLIFKSEKNYTGRISDGYHSFDELYYHKMILFSTICNIYKNKSWKSKFHHDGTMYKNHFIVGINTPKGHFSYHFEIKHWDMFKIGIYDKAPKWDGHKSKDIDRLLSLLS